MSIEEFVEKIAIHLEAFQEAVDADVESADAQETEDMWWERFIDFSMELDENE